MRLADMKSWAWASSVENWRCRTGAPSICPRPKWKFIRPSHTHTWGFCLDANCCKLLALSTTTLGLQAPCRDRIPSCGQRKMCPAHNCFWIKIMIWLHYTRVRFTRDAPIYLGRFADSEGQVTVVKGTSLGRVLPSDKNTRSAPNWPLAQCKMKWLCRLPPHFGISRESFNCLGTIWQQLKSWNCLTLDTPSWVALQLTKLGTVMNALTWTNYWE